jgi:hypothetical protein
MDTKICSKCKIDKNINEFYFNRIKNTTQSHCKTCTKEEAKIYNTNKRKTDIEWVLKDNKRRLNYYYKKKENNNIISV